MSSVISGAARMGQDTAGGVITSGSENVIINGSPAARVGDSVEGHFPWIPPHSGPTMATGSPTVITNGIQQCKEGDTATCGHASTGSQNVIVGNGSFQLNVSSVVVQEIEPGVLSVNGMIVYDSSPAGQAASIRSEQQFDSGLQGGGAASGGAPNTISGDTPPPAVTEETPAEVSAGCGTFNKVITPADMAKQVSKYFKLGTCKDLPVDQRGLTSDQIACNWAKLCLNVLDPVYDNFKFNFNSGFRNASRDTGGDHGLGCAADISMPTYDKTVAMFKWMIANQAKLNFSQIIFEKHNSAWVHVAFGGKGPKGGARTMWTYTGSAPYGHGGPAGSSLPQELTA